MARAADNLTVEERIERIATIFNTFRNPDKETVLTPWRVVNMHLGDCLGGYCFYDERYERMLELPRLIDNGKVTCDVFSPDSRVLEINSKSGLYPLFVAYNIYRRRMEEAREKYGDINRAFAQSLWDTTVEQNIFVICKTPMARSITRRTLVGFRQTRVNAQYYKDLIDVIKNNPATFVNEVRDGRRFWKANDKDHMTFNAIVGNPPYQLMGAAGGNNDAPIYQEFAMISTKLTKQYISLILKANWMSPSGGRENLLKDYRIHMLQCGNIARLTLFPNSKFLFKTAEIKGGVCYYLEDRTKKQHCAFTIVENESKTTDIRDLSSLDLIIRNPIIQAIVEKVEKIRNLQNMGSVESIISNDTPFGIPSNPRTSSKTPFCVYKELNSKHDVLLYHIENQSRKVEYVSISDIKKNVNDIDKIKVFNTCSGGSGNDPMVLGRPELAPKHSVCSQSYLYSTFNTIIEAKNFIKYIRSKFLRILVSAIKITQAAPNRVYKFVPLQDFTSNSDINWSKSISEIDAQLYRKYGLEKDEVEFIERMIKPME